MAVRRCLEEIVRFFRILDVGIDGGSDTVTYAAATSVSNVTNVTHKLGKIPKIVIVTSQNTLINFAAVAPLSETQIGVQGRTVDASNPGAGATRSFYWLVLA